MSSNRRRIILPIVILFAGVLVTIVMIKSRQPVATQPSEPFAPLVRVIDIAAADRQLVVTTHGTVNPRTEPTLVAEVSDRIVEVSDRFASGGFFKRGDVMVSIDAVDYELAVVRARSAVAQAQVRAETEAANAAVAREEWEELGDGSESPLATRELQVKEAVAALEAAKAELRRAERDLDRTSIRAPFDCRIRDKTADLGQFVAPGTPVARIYATDFVEVKLPIPDSDLSRLGLAIDYRRTASDAGPEVILSAEFAGVAREWHGEIVRVEGEIDAATRMVNIVAQVDDPYGAGRDGDAPLAVGLFVEARIKGRTVPNAVAIPRASLRGSNRIRFRNIVVAHAGRDEIVVSEGLQDGERICVSTLEAVTDGMRVRPVTSEPNRGATEPTTAADGGN